MEEAVKAAVLELRSRKKVHVRCPIHMDNLSTAHDCKAPKSPYPCDFCRVNIIQGSYFQMLRAFRSDGGYINLNLVCCGEMPGCSCHETITLQGQCCHDCYKILKARVDSWWPCFQTNQKLLPIVGQVLSIPEVARIICDYDGHDPHAPPVVVCDVCHLLVDMI